VIKQWTVRIPLCHSSNLHGGLGRSCSGKSQVLRSSTCEKSHILHLVKSWNNRPIRTEIKTSHRILLFYVEVWVMTPCGVAIGHYLHPEDGSSKVIRNVGNLPQHCTASQHIITRFESLPPWRPQFWRLFVLTHRTKWLKYVAFTSCVCALYMERVGKLNAKLNAW